MPQPSQSDRPLGRGLEHVSRVFLTQPSAERGPAPVQDRPPGGAAGTLLLRPAAEPGRDQVAAALKEYVGVIEDGLRVLDGGIPCGTCGEIDFLAVDPKNQLAVVDFETAATDELLIRGLGHVDWMLGNVPNLRRMFRGTPINFSLPPRLFLVAPRFSSRVRCAARQVACPEIVWVGYRLVALPGGAGILFERPHEE